MFTDKSPEPDPWSYLYGARRRVIACATVIEEMLPFLPADIPYEILDFGLHLRPQELKRVLQPGGRLATVNTAYGKGWLCDKQQFETLYVTADQVRSAIAETGFALEEMREIVSSDPDWRDQGYGRVLLMHARKV